MTGVAREAPMFAKGIDSYGAISAATAKQFRADGYEYVGRYLENLTLAERDGIFSAGLGIWLLETATTSPLSGSLGDARGAECNRKAMALQVPPRVHITIDLESSSGDPKTAVYPYTDHFSGTIIHGGYGAALYLGAGCNLTGHEAFAVPSVNAYIRGGSIGIPEPPCEFCMWQIPPLDQSLYGQRIDVSIAGRDSFGRGITMWWPQ